MTGVSLYNVMTIGSGKIKEKLLTVRVTEDKLAEFKRAAEMRGATMSGLLHQFIVKVIREEKERSPEAFQTFELINDVDSDEPDAMQRSGLETN